ncbi:MAG: hypothetical protein WDM92_07800 [Caulobacteraceae bacterium]
MTHTRAWRSFKRTEDCACLFALLIYDRAMDKPSAAKAEAPYGTIAPCFGPRVWQTGNAEQALMAGHLDGGLGGAFAGQERACC